jgi:transposase-like protein
MLDGVELSSDLTAIVALGITTDGRKLMLDFELGSSESKEVCNALLDRLIRRGFSNVKGARLLAVLDGSKALKNSVLEKFMNPLIQRCLVHKERNIRACLSRRHYGDLSRLFNNLREAQGAEAGREKLREIKNFLADKNKKALDSLEEAGEDLLALHVIGAPSSLNISLLSTNCIENSFKNVRRKIGRVNRWRTETNQAERWLAYALLEAENGFVRIKGWTDIPLLIEALRKHETV